jgi:inosose dehydratase
LCIDLGQLKLGGFNEVETVRKYADRIKFMHYKDVTFRGRPTGQLYPGGPLVPADTGAYTVDAKGRWVELGRGEVDFPGVTKVLLEAGYDGWIVDDLDSTSYTARDSVAACKEYLKHGLGL